MAQSKPIAQGADITERKQTEKALSRENNFSDAVMNSLPGLLFVFDDKGNTMQWNRNVEKVTGYSAKEISKMNILDFVAKEDQETAVEAMQEVLTKGQSSLEINVLSKPGKKTPFHIIGLRTKFENTTCVVCTGIDVTERKQTEKAQQDSEGRFRKLAEQSPNMIFINQKGRVVYANSICQTFTGYTKKELHSPDFNFFSLIAPESSELVKANFNRHMKGESVTPYEFTLLKKGGKKGEVILATALMEYEGSVAILGVLTDITERKRAEEVLGESEERYRTLFESAAQGILIADSETKKYAYANPAVCKMLGYSREELIKMGVGDIHPKTSLEHALADFAAQARGEKILSTLPCLKKDGTIIYADIKAAKAIIDGRECNIGFFTDVTERKQVEEALRESEARYRTLFQATSDSILIADLETKIFRYANPAACRLLGYSETELTTIGVAAIHPKADLPRVMAEFEAQVRGDKTLAAALPCLRKDGTIVYADVTASVMTIDGRACLVGFFRDITERKRAEEELLQSEKRYRTIIESIEDGYFEVDLAGTFTFVNDAQCRMTGSPRERLIGRNNRAYTTEEEAKKIYQLFSGIYKTGKPVTGFSFEYKRKDGTMAFNEMSASLIRDSEGKPIGFRGISRDVTERRQMEEKLAYLNLQNELILSSAAEGILGLDLQGNHTFVNPAAARMLGYEVEELLGRPSHSTWHHTKPDGSLYPKEECEIYAAYRDGAVHRKSAEVFWRKDGTGFPVEYASTPINEQGRTAGAVVTFADITERKRAEHQLRKRMNELRAFYSLAEITEREGISLDKLYQEFANILPQSWQYPEIACARIMIGDSEFCTENFAESPWKQSAPVKVHASVVGRIEVGYLEERPEEDEGPFLKEERLLIGAIAERIGHVTERKRAAEQLQRYAAELERNNEEVKNFAYIVSHDLRVPLVNLKGYTSELRSALEVIGSNFDAALPHLNDEKRSAVATALHEDVPEALEFITSSVSRMDSFINAVLILSRLGRQELKPESLDMNALVQTTVETISHQLQERRIEVIVGSLPQVVADRTAMEQITGNILSNAVKYLDSSRPGRIEVTAQANGAETTFRIRDNGRGIAAEDMDKVFAPFRRAGKQDTPGEGMGLAYVQTLVRRHGGRISCESEPGKGTTFTFTISTRSEKGAPDA